jgi:predicted SAM-dependent methyltransferase
MEKNYQKLHLGCGLNTPEGWLNIDGSWNARAAKRPFLKKIIKKLRLAPESRLDIPWNHDIFIHDLRNSLPFPDNSFMAVYASHLLEHLYLDEAENLLRECFRVLRPGGILRLVVPDLEEMVNNYLRGKERKEFNNQENLSAHKLMRGLNFRDVKHPSGGFFYKIYNCVKDFHSHKWMYDEESLIFHFKRAGFSDVRKMKLHESGIENIEKIELNKGLCIEGIKAK